MGFICRVGWGLRAARNSAENQTHSVDPAKRRPKIPLLKVVTAVMLVTVLVINVIGSF